VKLSILLRSSTYLTAISNRLASSATRARFLGMVVGEALSSLVDQPDKRMKFKLEELESAESKWYQSLTSVHDSVGPTDLLKPAIIIKPHERRKPQSSKTEARNTQLRGQSKIISIEELSDGSAKSEDGNFVPYAKPDSDPEDEDEDPTLVQRNKLIAPVYIRDLIVYLRDTENYDRQKLALSTAPTLIRRKSSFGTEVSDHVEELATLLVGLQDKFNIENFQDMRLQGMIATLLSQPPKMGRWFARTFFEGDYSLLQRASILTVLSIAARELGGFKEQDATLTKVNALPSNSFPSKLLPPKLHKVYASEQQQLLQSPVDAISQSLSNTMIQPLAASLADKATGPDVLKVRTFSSRLAVESRRKPPSANSLSAVVADSFFFPLTGRFFVHYKAYGGKNIIFEPFLLSSYLKTLSLILHASGTSTLQLPQMTSEMWDLLLSLRTEGENDKTVGQAVLFGFMTLLEINEDKRRLAEVHGRELLETQKWVEIFFERLGAGSEDDDKIRALAAGVLFKIQEVVEKYQALLVGELFSL
jgi:telomere length regulation protein